MTREETRQIREAALEDDDLTANARLLLCLIIDWHHKEKGCVMHDSTLGERLGVTARTVRRLRKELQGAGYLRVVHGAHRRELVPVVPDTADFFDDRNVQRPDTSVQTPDIDDETPDSSDRTPPDTSVQDREINYPEGASSARARGDRWAFLPSQHRTLLPTIEAEAGAPKDNPDVLNIASRHLQRPESDLAGTVDGHLDEHSTDEVIAAYVIGGKKGDRPLAYAKHILTMGWKEQGGDGAAVQLPDDKNTIHFGSTAP